MNCILSSGLTYLICWKRCNVGLEWIWQTGESLHSHLSKKVHCTTLRSETLFACYVSELNFTPPAYWSRWSLLLLPLGAFYCSRTSVRRLSSVWSGLSVHGPGPVSLFCLLLTLLPCLITTLAPVLLPLSSAALHRVARALTVRRNCLLHAQILTLGGPNRFTAWLESWKQGGKSFTRMDIARPEERQTAHTLSLFTLCGLIHIWLHEI